MKDGKIPFNETMLGMFSLSAAAVFLNIGIGQLRNYIHDGEIPERFAPRLKKMSELAILEIDEPPAEELIGLHAYRAITALRADDPKQALVWADQGRQDHPFDFDLAAPGMPTLLQTMSAKVAHAMVMARSPLSSELKGGLPAMRDLHHQVVRHMRANKIAAGHDAWQAWKYLRGMTTAFALGYYVGLIGKSWYADDALNERLKKPAYRKSLARIVIRSLLGDRADSSGLSLLKSVQRAFGRSPITTLAVWNLTQLVALADLPKSFAVCLADLYFKFEDTAWMKVKHELKMDPDTGPMFATAPVREFLEKIAAAEALVEAKVLAKAKDVALAKIANAEALATK